MNQPKNDMRLTRKDFLRVVACGAAGSITAATRDGSGAVEARAVVQRSGNPKKKMSAELKGTTEALVKFITTAKLENFPTDVVAQAKRCLIDGFAVILAGTTDPGNLIIRRYVGAMAARKEASIVGREPFMSSATLAALANGAAGHAMDFDDTQLSTTPDRTFGLLTHPTVPVLASSLAVAEQKRASGADFLEAFLTGDRKSTRLNSSHIQKSRMPSSA